MRSRLKPVISPKFNVDKNSSEVDEKIDRIMFHIHTHAMLGLELDRALRSYCDERDLLFRSDVRSVYFLKHSYKIEISGNLNKSTAQEVYRLALNYGYDPDKKFEEIGSLNQRNYHIA